MYLSHILTVYLCSLLLLANSFTSCPNTITSDLKNKTKQWGVILTQKQVSDVTVAKSTFYPLAENNVVVSIGKFYTGA